MNMYVLVCACASGDAYVYENVAVFHDENKNSKMPKNTHSNMHKHKKEWNQKNYTTTTPTTRRAN